MIGAIVENKEINTKEYLYFKNDNNMLFYYGFCINNNRVNPIDKNILQKIYNLLRVNNECIYIQEYLNYKVYLDTKNNIKHFIKNGIEDFRMLFEHNGEDIRVYNLPDKKNNKSSKKFCIGKFIINLSINFVILISAYSVSAPITQAILQDGTISNNFQYEISKIAYSVSDYVDLDIKCIDSTEAVELIKKSDIPSDLKEVLANENLLNDVFPYYKNTNMEYLIESKLKNLKLRIYEPTEFFITDPNTTDGFYDEMAPNVLNVKNVNTYKETAKHEFIHLMQSPDRKYIFLQEGVAEIASREYLDKNYDVYGYCVLNVSLLMDTIGPKIIWETAFSGDDTKLITILKNNLNENEYNELIYYLTNKPQETVESCQRINFIISNLYKNIYNEEISDNKNIFDNEGYHVKRVYFNEDKMINKQTDDEFISINEIFPDQVVRENKNIVR